MKKITIGFIYIGALFLISCNTPAKHDAASATEARSDNGVAKFLGSFIAARNSFRTEGNYFVADDSFIRIPDTVLIHKGDFAFLSHAQVALPDTFYPVVRLHCGNFNVCLIHRFQGRQGNFAAANSSLITLNKDSVMDVLPLVTEGYYAPTYKGCWVKDVDGDSIPEIVTRVVNGEVEGGDGTMEAPVVYKIVNGKFNQVNSVKIDTAAFNFHQF